MNILDIKKMLKALESPKARFDFPGRLDGIEELPQGWYFAKDKATWDNHPEKQYLNLFLHENGYTKTAMIEFTQDSFIVELSMKEESHE